MAEYQSNTTTVILNIYNEEYLLPYWLEYHRKLFDHGIVIDYDSTDNSLDIVRQYCPTWEIRRTTHIVNGKPVFEPVAIDQEAMAIENTIPGYKIFLNVTEWLMTSKPLKECLAWNQPNTCYLLNVFTPANHEISHTPRTTAEFIEGMRGKLILNTWIRRYRFIFNRANGNYTMGRHDTYVKEDYPADMEQVTSYERCGMCIVWCGYYPLTDKMFARKLQVKTHFNVELEMKRKSCWQHFYDLEKMKSVYAEICERSPLGHVDFNPCIDLACSLVADGTYVAQEQEQNDATKNVQNKKELKVVYHL